MSLRMLTVIKFELLKNFKKFSFWLVPIIISISLLIGFSIPFIIELFDTPDRQVNNVEVIVIDNQSILPSLADKEQDGLEFTLAEKSFEELKESLKNAEIGNLLVINDFYEVEFYFNSESWIDKQTLVNTLNTAFVEAQIQQGQIQTEPAEVNLLTDLNQTRVHIDRDNETIASGVSTFLGIVLFVLVIMFGTMFMNQIIVEKSNKVYEVILTSIDIREFFIAKYLSFILKFLLQGVLLIVTSVVPMFFLFPLFLNFTEPTATAPSSEMSEIESGLDFYIEIFSLFSLTNLSLIFIFSILGIILYTALMSLLGSCYNNYMEVSNSSLSWILTGPIMIPLFFNFLLIEYPNSIFTWIIQLFPLTSPIAFTSFIFTDFSWLKVILSLLFLIITIIFTFKIAIKVYLEGALSDGNIDVKKLGRIIINN